MLKLFQFFNRFGSSKRDGLKKSDVPGPGTYNLKPKFADVPNYVFNGSPPKIHLWEGALVRLSRSLSLFFVHIKVPNVIDDLTSIKIKTFPLL